MHNTVRFRSHTFNTSEPREYFINPCCFGADVAAWLRPRLQAQGYTVIEPGQEDWGWYLEASRDGAGHTLNIGLLEGEDTWQLLIERHRSLADRLRGRNKEAQPSFLADLDAVLTAAGEIRDVEWLYIDARGRESQAG